MNERELMKQGIKWYKAGKIELAYQIVSHFEALGFSRAEILIDIRKGAK